MKGKYNINNIQVKSDSLSATKFIRGEWKIPWEILEIIEDIKNLVEGKNVQYSHIYREGNQLADALANSIAEHTQ